MLCFPGRDVWLLEPCASCQVTSLLLSQVKEISSCAGIKGINAFFFGLSSVHGLAVPP